MGQTARVCLSRAGCSRRWLSGALKRWRRQCELALHPLRSGRDTVLYTALGTPAGVTHDQELGRALGRLLLALVQQSGIRRVVLCGGDTSSHAVQQLDLTALTFAGTLAPGPRCAARMPRKPLVSTGLELVLKGGQIGPEDFFRMAPGSGGWKQLRGPSGARPKHSSACLDVADNRTRWVGLRFRAPGAAVRLAVLPCKAVSFELALVQSAAAVHTGK